MLFLAATLTNPDTSQALIKYPGIHYAFEPRCLTSCKHGREKTPTLEQATDHVEDPCQNSQA